MEMKVRLTDIVDALETADPYSHNFVDKTTGEVVWISEMAMTSGEQEELYNRLDEHGFYRMPASFEIHEYDIMDGFVYGLPRTPARDRLEKAIRGRGAFRRFKNSVRQMGIEQIWYDYRDDAYKQMAVRWCEENQIGYME